VEPAGGGTSWHRGGRYLHFHRSEQAAVAIIGISAYTTGFEFLASGGLIGCGSLEALMAPLILQDPSNLRWLVGVTVWVFYLSGADYTVALRHELTMLQNDPAVRSLMEAPAGNDDLGRAVQVAHSVLAGNSIFEAVESLTGQ
jgi:hypothetical protein